MAPTASRKERNSPEPNGDFQKQRRLAYLALDMAGSRFLEPIEQQFPAIDKGVVNL